MSASSPRAGWPRWPPGLEPASCPVFALLCILRHAFAFDRHFATAGFVRIPTDVPAEQVR